MIPWRNFRRFFYKATRQPLYAAEVFKRRLGAYAWYTLGRGYARAPEAITLFLTHRCNLRCAMCGQWGEGGVTRKEGSALIQSDLLFDQAKALIDEVARFTPNITLFGGEPLLYGHCIELIRRIKGNGMHCLMITNGSLLEGLAREIVDSGLDELNVSLDGGASLHDRIRGMPGLFDRIMKALALVNRIKKERHKKRPLINMQCTINAHNYEHLEEMVAVARRAEADSLTFHNLIFLDQKILDAQKEYDRILKCDSRNWEGFVFSPGIGPVVLLDTMKRILSARYPFSVDFYPNLSSSALMAYYKECGYVPLEYDRRCASPWIAAYVFPDGEVRPCLNCSYSYGSIMRSRFAEIWNSPEAVTYRRLLKKTGIFPVCARCTELYRY